MNLTKKIISMLLALTMVFSVSVSTLAATGTKTLVVYFSQPETTDPNNMTTEEANSTVVIDGEVLGNTQYVAYVIQEYIGADIFRIEPKTPFPTDHKTLVDLAKEQQNQNFRPELLAKIENLDEYDTIFLGYPNWWGDVPMILYSFLETHDLSGKTIIPFNTHGGSGFSNTLNTIMELQPNATVNKDGFTVSRNDVQEAKPDIIAWIKTLNVATAPTTTDVATSTTITLQINNPVMTVNGTEKPIDENGTAPITQNDRTLLPVRAVVETMGGRVAWNNATQTATLTCGNDVIKLTIGNKVAYRNDAPETLDVAPALISDRTMLPIRFVAESFGFDVGWSEATQTVTISAKNGDVATETSKFDFESKTVTLNNGIKMPVLGLGTFALQPAQAEESVYHALLDGYRLIDTANAYMNERAVGRGIKKSGVAREEIFVTTKLWPSDYDNVDKAIDETLARLDLEYIDLLLLHQPYGNYVGAYQAMEKAISEGKVRSIGLSNTYKDKFDEIMSVATIPPAVLQIERNPYVQHAEMQEYIKPYGTVMEDWFPLGGRSNSSNRQESLFNDEIILEIAKAHDKTAAQVILRWHLQSGGIAIPGSSNPAHILENISIFNFELTDAEMQRISTLDTDELIFNHRTPDENSGGMYLRPMDFNAQE